ncbi:MAG: hypothetical protein KDA53_00995 [Hyphomonas sp.]|nr:hypothetical protein [Hyphomonas sp.]
MKRALLPWSRLAAFGNTPLAKAVVFSPIVAGYVYYSSSYLQQSWGLQNAVWLYWSLICLSVGQGIYLLASPRAIKKHGDNIEGFVDAALRTWSEQKFQIEAINYVGSRFKPEGSLLLFPPQDPTSTGLETSLQRWGGIGEGNIHRDAVRVVRHIAELRPISPHTTIYSLRSDHFEEVLSGISGSPLTDAQLDDALEVVNFMNIRENENDWKKYILEKIFLAAEKRLILLRWATAIFYAIGSTYFIWNTCLTVSRMLVVSFGGLLKA